MCLALLFPLDFISNYSMKRKHIPKRQGNTYAKLMRKSNVILYFLDLIPSSLDE
ncbi:hypothetical protein PanWU01x14_171250 [Parasponia andersonii]|uniref:Uncharacterized protein n=1 Tax=Parasponia andersonii TaxID=3476 RepID=A0A2P5C9Q9_PARAD|nr:hypothetical protein PanWU01x14_171250 [Parasponia andersonii]